MKNTSYTLIMEAESDLSAKEEVSVTDFNGIKQAFDAFVERHGTAVVKAVVCRDGIVFGTVTDGRLYGRLKAKQPIEMGEIG